MQYRTDMPHPPSFLGRNQMIRLAPPLSHWNTRKAEGEAERTRLELDVKMYGNEAIGRRVDGPSGDLIIIFVLYKQS